MRKRSITNVKPTVATHFPSQSRRFDINHNVHMFTQDIQSGLMPIGGRTEKRKNFAITCLGDEREQLKAEQLIGEIAPHDRRGFTEMVCDAVDEIARYLSWEGCAVYELVRGDDESQHVWAFTSKRLWKLPGCFLQVIPRGDWDLWKRKLVVVPATRIWYLEMPSVLGGRREYRKVLRRLKKFERLGPEFWRKDLEHGGGSTGFDLQRYALDSDIYIGQVTKRWGWNRRDWSQERCTEFFTFYKFIRFSWAKAILRQHIVAELNRLLARLGIKCRIEVTGLPTPADILQTGSDLADGKISFAVASDRVRL